jgi:hypothetical protein
MKSATGGQEVRIGGPRAEDGEVQLQPEVNHRQCLPKSGCQYYKTFFLHHRHTYRHNKQQC